MTNPERRDRGLAYFGDAEVFREMGECKKRLAELNSADPWDYESVSAAAKRVIPDSKGLFVVPPFYCEYGTHVSIGENAFININCVIIDVARVTIGDRCLIGPNVSIYTAGHPIHPRTRATGYEYGKPVTVGDDVWLGGGSILCPGVTVGSGSVIGAGSVVTRDIPPMVVAAGNPCRVIREITGAERKKLFKNEDFDDEIWAEIGEKAYDDKRG